MVVGGLPDTLTVEPVVSNMASQDLSNLENLGDPQPEHLKLLCARYEEAKQDLVRLNISMNNRITALRRIIGSQTLGMGLVAWFLRGVESRTIQKRVLQAMLIVCILSITVTPHTAILQSRRAQDWVPLGLQLIVLGLLVSGLPRLRKAKD